MSPAHPPTNIIVVLCDDLGFGDVEALTNGVRPPRAPVLQTPNLSRMAASGVVLTGMYCSAPVCAPSRASLLTGVTQGHSELRNNGFDEALEDAPNLASVLRFAGYRTAAVGKWGLAGQNADSDRQRASDLPAYPTKRGFDDFFGYVSHSDGHEHYPKEGLYRGPKQVWHNDAEVSQGLDGCYTTDLFTAFAKNWIEQVRTESPGDPFFLYLAYDTPHAVQELPACAYPAGAGKRGGLRWTGRAGEMINTADGVPDTWIHPDYRHALIPSTAQSWPDVYKRYATAVRRIDDCVGDLLALLSDLGIADDTMVLFTSDNGPSAESYLEEALEADFFQSFGPFDGIKRDCWEGGVRVGALATWPRRIPAGTVRAEATQFHDVLPTLAGIAGLGAPARSDGVSLLPLLTAGEKVNSTVYVEYAGPGATPDYAPFAPHRRQRVRGEMQMLRIQQLVGVRYDIQHPSDLFEIYNIELDPAQRDDLGPHRPDLQRMFQIAARRRRRVHPTAHRPYDCEPIPALEIDEPASETVVTVWPCLRDIPWLPASPSPWATASDILDTVQMTVATGELLIPEEGSYRFDADAREVVLRLHETVVLERASHIVHDAPVTLAAGRHPYRLTARSEELAAFRWQTAGSSSGQWHSAPVT